MTAVAGRGSVRGLLSFRLGVIARFSARSIALPFASDATLGSCLKLTPARLQVNDPFSSVAAECQASIGNNNEMLTAADIDSILADSGTSGDIVNSSLLEWFDERDAQWLDTVRRNIATLPSPNRVAVAQKLVMDAGQYALSFSAATASLRQPLSNVFLRLCSRLPNPFDNGKRNVCTVKSPRQFAAESEAELMFLSLPAPSFEGMRVALGVRAWREEWIRGNGGFWKDFEKKSVGQLHGRIPARTIYLRSLEQLLRSARKMKHWVIELPTESAIASSDVMETIGAIRPIKKVYTKDLSEMGRGRSTIVTA